MTLHFGLLNPSVIYPLMGVSRDCAWRLWIGSCQYSQRTDSKTAEHAKNVSSTEEVCKAPEKCSICCCHSCSSFGGHSYLFPNVFLSISAPMVYQGCCKNLVSYSQDSSHLGTPFALLWIMFFPLEKIGAQLRPFSFRGTEDVRSRMEFFPSCNVGRLP